MSAAQTTVAELVDAYLSYSRSRLAKATFEMRERYILDFKECCGDLTIAECKPLHLIKWLDSKTTWQNDWTKNAVIKHIRTMFNWGIDIAEVCERNPFRKVSHPRGMPRRDITQEEFQAMLRGTEGRRAKYRPSPGARMRQVLIFMYFTGCRPIEMCTLQWCHVDLERGLITLRVHKTARTQRDPRPRVITLHPVAIALLRHIQRRARSEHVFLTYRKTPWNRHTLSQRVRRAREKAGIPDDAKLYGVRHAFGTRAVINGCDIKTIATLMGHTTTRMTEHYLHTADKHGHLAGAILQVNRRKGGVK